MTNTEALLRVLNGEALAEDVQFTPQTNEQAYLAYAVGLITDPDKLPTPQSMEQALLLSYCVSGGGVAPAPGGDGVELPDLTKPAAAYQILLGLEAINQDGQKMTGTMPNNGAINETLDSTNSEVVIPAGYHNGAGRVAVFVESLSVKPSTEQQEIKAPEGVLYGKVVVDPAESGGSGIKISDASYLFYNNARIDQIADFIKMFSGVTSFSNTFYGCGSLYNLDLGDIDTSEATTMNNMFNGCQNLTELDVSHFNTKNVKDMNGMFNSCKRIRGLDLSSFDTSSVTSMGSMFSYCNELESVDLSNFDTSKVTGMGNMFYQSPKIVEIKGFSATNKAGISIGFPLAYSGVKAALRWLTFRTDLPDGVYAIQSAIDVRNCSIDREGALAMFNSLPDVSALGLSSSYTKITLTGNPCLTGSYSGQAGSYPYTISGYTAFKKFLSDRYLEDANFTVNITEGEGKPESYTGNLSDMEMYFGTSEKMSFDSLKWNAYQATPAMLTAEDRAIAVNKGWTIVE